MPAFISADHNYYQRRRQSLTQTAGEQPKAGPGAGDVHDSQPCSFTSKFMDGKIKGKGGIAYGAWAFCLRRNISDSPTSRSFIHDPRPARPAQTTIYKFSAGRDLSRITMTSGGLHARVLFQRRGQQTNTAGGSPPPYLHQVID